MLLEAILATVIGGLIKDWLVQDRFWRPMAYVTVAGAAMMIPIVALCSSPLTADYWMDLALSGIFAAVVSMFAVFPSRSIRLIAFGVPVALLASATAISQSLSMPHGWIALLSIWPLAYVASLFVSMPVALFVITRPDFNPNTDWSWDLVEGKYPSLGRTR